MSPRLPPREGPRELEPFFLRERPPAMKSLIAKALAGTIVLLVGVGVLAVAFAPKSPPQAVTIQPADRAAPHDLVMAAEALHFRSASGSGSIERGPAPASAPSDGSLLAVGSAAPRFVLSTPPGKIVDLASLRGKRVLLEFFATWCPHCASEAPHLARLYRALAGKRIAFVGVNADSEDTRSVFAYHVYFGLPFPAVVDAGSHPRTWPVHGPLGHVADTYRVSLLPTFYVLDTHGRVAWAANGEQPDALLRKLLLRAR